MKKGGKKKLEKRLSNRESGIALLELQALTASFMKRAFIEEQIAFLKEEIKRQEETGLYRELSGILHEKKRKIKGEYHMYHKYGEPWASKFHLQWLDKAINFFQSIGE